MSWRSWDDPRGGDERWSCPRPMMTSRPRSCRGTSAARRLVQTEQRILQKTVAATERKARELQNAPPSREEDAGPAVEL